MIYPGKPCITLAVSWGRPGEKSVDRNQRTFVLAVYMLCYVEWLNLSGLEFPYNSNGDSRPAPSTQVAVRARGALFDHDGKADTMCKPSKPVFSGYQTLWCPYHGFSQTLSLGQVQHQFHFFIKLPLLSLQGTGWGNTIVPSYLRQLLSVSHRNSIYFPRLCLAGSETAQCSGGHGQWVCSHQPQRP